MAEEKRGRLSSVDLLPEEAEEDVTWAFGELKRRKLTQEEIRDQLNLKLHLKGIGPISKSAFNRASIRLSKMAHRLGEVREIAGVLAAKFEDGGDEHLTLLVSETIKVLVYEMLENAGRLKTDGLSAEMMMNFSRALKFAEEAKKVSADMRTKIEKEFATKASQAVDQVAKVRGLSPDVKEELRRDLFGVIDGTRNRT